MATATTAEPCCSSAIQQPAHPAAAAEPGAAAAVAISATGAAAVLTAAQPAHPAVFTAARPVLSAEPRSAAAQANKCAATAFRAITFPAATPAAVLPGPVPAAAAPAATVAAPPAVAAAGHVGQPHVSSRGSPPSCHAGQHHASTPVPLTVCGVKVPCDLLGLKCGLAAAGRTLERQLVNVTEY